jgi:hypothetical protein
LGGARHGARACQREVREIERQGGSVGERRRSVRWKRYYTFFGVKKSGVEPKRGFTRKTRGGKRVAASRSAGDTKREVRILYGLRQAESRIDWSSPNRAGKRSDRAPRQSSKQVVTKKYL